MCSTTRQTAKRIRSESSASESSGKRPRLESLNKAGPKQQASSSRPSIHTNGHSEGIASASTCSTAFQQAGVPAALAGLRSRLSQVQNSAPMLRIASRFALEDAKLQLPAGLSQSESTRRFNEMVNEAKYQEEHPPVLPPSQIEPVGPKEQVESFMEFPEGLDPTERQRRIEKNNEIAAKLQRIDRERNNMAAKRSRQSRLEALANTRQLLNQKSVECAWFRMKVVSLGGSTRDWDKVPPEVKAGMIKDVTDRVGEVDKDNAEKKKREESEKRIERNKIRAATAMGTSRRSDSSLASVSMIPTQVEGHGFNDSAFTGNDPMLLMGQATPITTQLHLPGQDMALPSNIQFTNQTNGLPGGPHGLAYDVDFFSPSITDDLSLTYPMPGMPSHMLGHGQQADDESLPNNS